MGLTAVLLGIAISVLASADSKVARSTALAFEEQPTADGRPSTFLCRARGYTISLTSSEVVLSAQRGRLQMKLAGANRSAEVTGLEELAGKVNYYLGQQRSQWRQAVVTYSKVGYRNVYPGTDLLFYGAQGGLEFDLVVAPGADPRAIHFQFPEAERLDVSSGGDLWITTGASKVLLRKPVVYQKAGETRREVPGQFVKRGKREAGLVIAEYDRTKPLIIDPVLAYSTYLGGADLDDATGIARDASGNVYVVGNTFSQNFPTLNARQGSLNATSAMFISKFGPSGEMLYSTYLGGRGQSFANAIAVDTAGNASITGYTASSDFPVQNAFQTTVAGFSDAVVTKLDPAGQLLYSTYLGSKNTDQGLAVAADSTGNTYVVGLTWGNDFPVRSALQPVYGGSSSDAFLAKFDPAGSLLFSTFLGGSGEDHANAVALDAAGNIYLAGYTLSTNFPVANAFQPQLNTGGNCVWGLRDPCPDAFVAKLNPAASTLLYSTYLGGSAQDQGYALAVDAVGNAYLTGATQSPDFPTKNAFSRQYGGGRCDFGPCADAFVAKLDSAGSLLYSTYVGGGSEDSGHGITADGNGNAFVVGATTSADFPVRAALQPVWGGGRGSECGIQYPDSLCTDAFVAQFDPSGALINSTFLGGSHDDSAAAVLLDSAGNLYIAGSAGANFPITANGTQTRFNPGVASGSFVGILTPQDAFLAKITPGNAPSNAVPTATSLDPPSVGAGSAAFTLTLHGSAFAPGVRALWNNQERTTALLSDTQLDISISARDVIYGGLFTVQAVNPAPGGGPSPALTFTVNNLVPTVQLLTPARVVPGSVAFDLSVNGSDFVPGSVVRWNGSARPTRFVTKQQVVASITSADIAVPGSAGITVFNPSPGGGESAPATLNITVGTPALNPGGVVNGAYFRAGPPVAPGSIASVFGVNLAPAPASSSTLPLPATLGGASFRFNSTVSASLFYVSPLQVNLQVPWELAGQSQATLQSSAGGVAGNTISVSLAAVSPGIFTLNQSGAGPGAIVIAQTGERRAARPGEIISIYCTGLGPVTNPPPNGVGAPAAPLATTPSQPTVTLGQLQAPVLFSGLAPGFVGLYQVNAQVPANAPAGSAIPVQIRMNGTDSNIVTMTIQP